MAAVVQGVVLANAGLRELRRLREFKEALTVILLSFIFVILAADLRLEKVWQLGWGAAGVVAVLVWIARPLAVGVSTLGSSFTLRERAFIAWICPRGIVAAAVAGLFRLELERAGIPGGHRLEALVFVTVALTVCVQGLTAGPVARLLRVDQPSLTGTIVVGADRFARLFARVLVTLGRQVAIVDRSAHLCRVARSEGFSVVEGDALSPDTLEEAGALYVDTAVAMTRNAELNALVAQRVRDNFRVERVLAVTEEPDAPEPTAGGRLFPGDFPGIDDVNRLLRLNQLELGAYEVVAAEAVGRDLGDLPYGEDEFALLLQRRLSVLAATGDRTLDRGDILWCLRPLKRESPLATLLKPIGQPVAPGPLVTAPAPAARNARGSRSAG
jgi:Trk K+ transport system NAD-binding subunit